jgi:hypothetical protein
MPVKFRRPRSSRTTGIVASNPRVERYATRITSGDVFDRNNTDTITMMSVSNPVPRYRRLVLRWLRDGRMLTPMIVEDATVCDGTAVLANGL